MMRELWLYDAATRLGLRNYRAKIMTVAFVGTHIPLLALVAYVALKSSTDWHGFLATLAVALVATLIGTVITLFVLNHLLRPVLLTARTLRRYRQSRDVGTLPTHYGDEVGTLMADASHTLIHLEKALDALEYSDARTGMPNRKRLVQDIGSRVATGKAFAIWAVRFATYDRLLETLDLAAAEDAAAEIASRLTNAVRDVMPVYRVGGTDFVLLAGEMESAQACEAAVRRLIETCSGPLDVATVTVEPAFQAGVALAPADSDQPETLIDHALAAAAVTDEAQVRFHSPAARAAAFERLKVEQDIRRALAHDEFVLHYQPVVDLSAREAVGAEALIRWQHPERGLLLPGTFIGIAEATGLIDPIGLWVLRRACKQIKEWQVAGFDRSVAINLSARQFLDPNLIHHVRDAVDAAGISPDRLEVELTESSAMTDHDHTRMVFGKLRDLGVSIAIDDFGTGFASMSYLRKLPFNKLKIDREFVSTVDTNRESQAICGALVTLAEGLGLKVLAEGTETAEEVSYLQSRGCNLYQGYFFAKALSPDQFDAGAQRAALISTSFQMRGRHANERGSALPIAV